MSIALAILVTQPATAQDKENRTNDDSYVLAPGDVLSLKSSQNSEGTMIPVLPDGTATTQYAGVIRAAGMSLSELNIYVNEHAKKYLASQQITISLAQKRQQHIYLLGEVVHPGLYSIENDSDFSPMSGEKSPSDRVKPEDESLSKTKSFTLSHAIQMAGGLKDTADVQHIRITRRSPKETIQIDMKKSTIEGGGNQDIELQAGDVVFVFKSTGENSELDVDKRKHISGMVRVVGDVKSPGLVHLESTDDILRSSPEVADSILRRQPDLLCLHGQTPMALSLQKRSMSNHLRWTAVARERSCFLATVLSLKEDLAVNRGVLALKMQRLP